MDGVGTACNTDANANANPWADFGTPNPKAGVPEAELWASLDHERAVFESLWPPRMLREQPD